MLVQALSGLCMAKTTGERLFVSCHTWRSTHKTRLQKFQNTQLCNIHLKDFFHPVLTPGQWSWWSNTPLSVCYREIRSIVSSVQRREGAARRMQMSREEPNRDVTLLHSFTRGARDPPSAVARKLRMKPDERCPLKRSHWLYVLSVFITQHQTLLNPLSAQQELYLKMPHVFKKKKVDVPTKLKMVIKKWAFKMNGLIVASLLYYGVLIYIEKDESGWESELFGHLYRRYSCPVMITEYYSV